MFLIIKVVFSFVENWWQKHPVKQFTSYDCITIESGGGDGIENAVCGTPQRLEDACKDIIMKNKEDATSFPDF